MFKIAVNNLVQSIGDDVYLSSPSTAASKNLAPLSLVERKRGVLSLKRFRRYYTTDFSLTDVIDKTECQVRMSEEPFCTFNRKSTMQVESVLKGYLKGIFDAGVRRVDSITISVEFGQLSISELNMQSLLDYIEGSKLNTKHALMKEMRKLKRRALCVVTGVVKTTVPVTVSAVLNTSIDGSADIEVTNPVLASTGIIGGKLKGVHEKDSSRTLHIPAGTTVAYQVLEMAVDKKGRFELMVSHDAKGGFYSHSLANRETQKDIPKRTKKETPRDISLKCCNNNGPSSSSKNTGRPMGSAVNEGFADETFL